MLPYAREDSELACIDLYCSLGSTKPRSQSAVVLEPAAIGSK